MDAAQFIVIPIDTEKISDWLHEQLQTSKDQITYAVEKIAWVKKTDCITDNECVYFNLQRELKDGEIVYSCNLDVRRNTKTDSGWSCSMFPEFSLHFILDELIEKYGLPETDLKTFMKGRYDYNPRITTNTKNLMKTYANVLAIHQ